MTAIVACFSLLQDWRGLEPALAEQVDGDIAADATRLQHSVEGVLVMPRIERGVQLERQGTGPHPPRRPPLAVEEDFKWPWSEHPGALSSPHPS